MKLKNIFKSEEIKKEVETLEPTNEPQQELINLDAELYKDIHFTQDRLLKEAEDMLKENDKQTIERLSALDSLGFYCVPSVAAAGNRQYELNKYERIKYYKETYPLNKFIDYNTVENICEKYNLYCTGVTSFTGEIPVENQKEIVAFRIKEKDVLESFGYEMTNSESEEMVMGKDLKIIAPEKEIDMTYMVKREGSRMLQMKDPIVLQEVEHGYLIVSCWGLEAGDAMVTNEINN